MEETQGLAGPEWFLPVKDFEFYWMKFDLIWLRISNLHSAHSHYWVLTCWWGGVLGCCCYCCVNCCSLHRGRGLQVSAVRVHEHCCLLAAQAKEEHNGRQCGALPSADEGSKTVRMLSIWRQKQNILYLQSEIKEQLFPAHVENTKMQQVQMSSCSQMSPWHRQRNIHIILEKVKFGLYCLISRNYFMTSWN